MWEQERESRDERSRWKAQSWPMFPIDRGGGHYGEALMWTRWKEPQPGDCCQVIELQLGLLVSHLKSILCCCFLNRFPVSLALRLIRTNDLPISTDCEGHQSLFDLSRLWFQGWQPMFLFCLWQHRGHPCLRDPGWLYYMVGLVSGWVCGVTWDLNLCVCYIYGIIPQQQGINIPYIK